MNDSDTGGTIRVSAELATVARETAPTVGVVEVGPTGAEALGSLCLLTRGGQTAYHADCSAARVRELARALEDGAFPTADAVAVVSHEQEATRLPQPSTGPLSVGVRRVLGRCGWVDPTAAPSESIAAFVQSNPEKALDRVRSAGLRGRGRGDASRDEPIAEMWETAAAAVDRSEHGTDDNDGSDAVVVVNATETDRRVRGDALLLDGDTASLLDSACAVAAIVDAPDVVVALPETTPSERVRRIEAASAALDTAVEIQLVGVPATYLVTEPTIVLEALEGADRLEARRRPPGPEAYGLYGRPTVVHTPRTLAQVRGLLDDATADGAMGAPDDPGTRLVTVSGDVAAPVTVELPTDASLSSVNRSVEVDHDEVKMACVGGRFGGLTRTLDFSVSALDRSAAGLGTDGGVELFDHSRCAVLVAGLRTRAAAEENCGRCVPCREGTTQLTDLLRAVYRGSYDADAIDELARVVGTTSLCSFGRDAVRPVTTAMASFEAEFEAHAAGHCPSGACRKERLEGDRRRENAGFEEVDA